MNNENDEKETRLKLMHESILLLTNLNKSYGEVQRNQRLKIDKLENELKSSTEQFENELRDVKLKNQYLESMMNELMIRQNQYQMQSRQMVYYPQQYHRQSQPQPQLVPYQSQFQPVQPQYPMNGQSPSQIPLQKGQTPPTSFQSQMIRQTSPTQFQQYQPQYPPQMQGPPPAQNSPQFPPQYPSQLSPQIGPRQISIDQKHDSNQKQNEDYKLNGSIDEERVIN